MNVDPVAAVIGLLTALVTGGGLYKVLEWTLAKRRQDRQLKAEEREGVIKEYNSFLGELRGEIHALRDRLHNLVLQHEIVVTENAGLKANIKALEDKIGVLAVAGDVALITVDNDGIVLAWSPSATSLFGYGAEEAIGKNLTELIIPEAYHEFHTKAMRVCYEERRPPRRTPLIFRAKNKWGHEFLVDVTLDGKPANGHWYYTGTVRKRSEKFD